MSLQQRHLNAATLEEYLRTEPELVNERDKLDRSLLHWAVDNVAPKCITVLIEHGIDVDHVDRTGYTALYNVSTYLVELRPAKLACAKKLLAARASVDRIGEERGDYSPLSNAAFLGDHDCVQLLLEHGADPNFQKQHWSRSPLHKACDPWFFDKTLRERGNPGNEKVIRLLIQYGGDLAIEIGEYEVTPAELASDEKRQDVLDALERIKQNPDPPLQSDKTPET